MARRRRAPRRSRRAAAAFSVPAAALATLLAAAAAAGHAGAASSSSSASSSSRSASSGGAGAKKKVKSGREALSDPDVGSALDPHPDPNDEHHPGMIYVGRMDGEGRRVGFDVDNGIKYIFGTSFDESHRDIEEADLRHEHYGPDSHHDLADRAHGHTGKTREQILKERRHGNVDPSRGPRPFGHVDEHPLDGGATPPKVVHVEPFFLDERPVTNREFAKFVRATYYETEAEQFGWSFVLRSFVPKAKMLEGADADPEAEDWVAIDGAYWRSPEGPGSSYKHREDHPVVHVSHRDAAEYCTWKGKRLPGEWEWEGAARADRSGPKNRTLFVWGEEDTVDAAKGRANLWGEGAFPWENRAEDGWRGTSPVGTYPPNSWGFHDMTGNVWEWMRGGKHKSRIVRGGSYVDSLDGSFNHAATLGARATMHGTTSAGNVGFRCAKAPKRRTEYHWAYHDEGTHGALAVEDEFGKRHMAPQRGWEDRFVVEEDDDEDDEFDDLDGEFESVDAGSGGKRKKRRVIKPRTRFSNEL